MLKKGSRNSKEDDGRDVPADNAAGTMRRFSEGLKQVLAVTKAHPSEKRVPKSARQRVHRRVSGR